MPSQDTHLFTTDNELMVELGLGAVTTGILSELVTSQSHSVFFGDNYSVLDILGTDKVVGPYFSIDIFRPTQRNSEDVTYNWICDLTNAASLYSNTNVDNWEYTANGVNHSWDDIKDTLGGVGVLANDLEADEIIYPMIITNDFVNDIRNKSDATYEAKALLIRDIRNSVNGGIQWSTTININVPESQEAFEQRTIRTAKVPLACDMPITWTLSLYSKAPTKRHRPSLVSPLIADRKKNAFGVAYSGRNSELRLQAHTGSNPADKTAAPLKTNFNEFTNEMEAGTTQAIAVMITDLPAATYPDAGAISNPASYDDVSTGFKVTHGLAMPITMKNANPYKWGPEWRNCDFCGLTDEEKKAVFTIPVQNKLQQNFKQGDSVILQRIDGTWQPLAGGEGGTLTITLANPSVDNWSITSMVSNATHYFRTNNVPVRYDEYENGIYNAYYGLTNPYEDHIKHDKAGYVQITSFDMMGASVGGNRTKHALCNTQLGTRADGSPEGDITQVNSTVTTPFFGCVFPDGYVGGDKYTEYRTGSPPLMTAVGEDGYINDIAAGTQIFSAETATFSNTDGSPFQDGLPSLRQLPADIALNSSPSSDGIGSPITIVHNLWEMFNASPGDIQTTIKRNHTDLDRYAWLQRDDGGDTFGLTPKNKNKIQFRPLKAEIYATFEIAKGGLPPGIVDGGQRGSWANRGYLKTSYDGEPPISEKVYERILGTDNGGIVGSNGFKHNIDIINETTALPSNNSAFPLEYWSIDDSRGWQANPPRPGGAVGIIGAQVTVTANTAISFNVTNYFGMDDWFGQATGFGGPNYSSYGDKPTDYNALNNTSLHARIYQHWPKKQTIYDPRFFAVFHFSEGFGDPPEIKEKLMVSDSTGTVQEIIGDATVGAAQKWGARQEPEKYSPTGSEEGRWSVDVIKYPTVDLRVPTLIGTDAYGVLPGAATFTDSSYDEEYGSKNANDVHLTGVWNDTGIWRNPEDWQLNTELRAKLLPAAIGMNTIGIVSASDGVANPDQVFIQNGGEGYSTDDVFTTEGGTGQGVTLTPIISDPTTGKITGFTVTGSGGEFLPSDFFSPTDTPTYSQAQVKLISSADTGKDLEAFIKYGSVISQRIGIDKPKQATDQDIFDLVNQPPVPHRGVDRKTLAMSASKAVNAIISYPSTTNQYDVFLHYHNDISHVFDNASWAGSLGPASREQYVELEVTPDGSTSTSVNAADGSQLNTDFDRDPYNVFEAMLDPYLPGRL